jgi:hypothetical protein
MGLRMLLFIFTRTVVFLLLLVGYLNRLYFKAFSWRRCFSVCSFKNESLSLQWKCNIFLITLDKQNSKWVLTAIVISFQRSLCLNASFTLINLYSNWRPEILTFSKFFLISSKQNVNSSIKIQTTNCKLYVLSTAHRDIQFQQDKVS